ncbi:MAG: alpha/beta hydrolase [Planctomycetales bacterium]|nr:alpha/beta hydrolase [Planctomycetales bacterium]
MNSVTRRTTASDRPRILNKILASAATTFLLVIADSSMAADGSVRLQDGRQLCYSEYGDPRGQLVLFFHGTPGSQRDAAVVHEELRAAHIRLITPSRPGMGLSTFDPGRRILDWPADVSQLVAAVGEPDQAFGILAMSGGTPYALATVRAMPYRITHVTIASAFAPPEACVPKTDANQTLDFMDRRPRLARLGVGLMGRRLDTKPEKVLKHVAHGWSETDRQLVLCSPKLKREVIATLREATRCGPDGVLHDSRLLSSCWGFQVCEAQGPPICLFHGGEDEVAPVQMAYWLQAQLPGSSLTVDPRAGHLSTLWWHAEEILDTFDAPRAVVPTLPAPELAEPELAVPVLPGPVQ